MTKKILFYISTILGGGAARVMVNIANGLSARGYKVCFVTNFPSEHEYKLEHSIQRVNLEEIENKDNIIKKNVNRIRALRKVISREKPYVSIAFMRENNFRLIISSLGLPTKTIVSVRNDPAKEYGRKGDQILANVLFSKADKIVFQTNDAKHWFPKNIQKKSAVILNQVDEKFFTTSINAGKYIVACGRLSKQKNYPMMLEAFAKVLETHPTEKLRIYGEGELREELISITKKLGISDSVEFMGFSSEMVEVYNKAKFLVMTSDYEGMPNVVLESFASSVPVISTDCPCGGPRMIIDDTENGYLIPPGDVTALATAICMMLDSPQMVSSMRKKAREKAECFSPAKVLLEWEKIISQE